MTDTIAAHEDKYLLSWTSQLDELDATRFSGLVTRVPDASVFNDETWVTTCLALRERDVSHWILNAETRSGLLVASLCFSVRRERHYGVGLQVVRWVQYPLGDRVVPLVDPAHRDVIAHLVAAFRKAPFEWHCMIWSEIPQDIERSSAWIHAARAAGLGLTIRETSRCPVLVLDGRDRAAIDATLSGSTRQRAKRSRKRLSGETDVVIKHFRPAPSEVSALLDELKVVEDSSWKGDEGVGIFRGSSLAFFRNMASSLAKAGVLDVATLHIGKTLVSYRFGFLYKNTFLDYNLAYLPAYHRIGAGRILLDELVTSCARQGYQAVDASRVGAHSAHLLFEYANSEVIHQCWTWYGPGLRVRWFRLVTEVLKPWAKAAQRWWRTRRMR